MTKNMELALASYVMDCVGGGLSEKNVSFFFLNSNVRTIRSEANFCHLSIIVGDCDHRKNYICGNILTALKN